MSHLLKEIVYNKACYKYRYTANEQRAAYQQEPAMVRQPISNTPYGRRTQRRLSATSAARHYRRDHTIGRRGRMTRAKINVAYERDESEWLDVVQVDSSRNVHTPHHNKPARQEINSGKRNRFVTFLNNGANEFYDSLGSLILQPDNAT